MLREHRIRELLREECSEGTRNNKSGGSDVACTPWVCVLHSIHVFHLVHS